jgi:hypothetical protein
MNKKQEAAKAHMEFHIKNLKAHEILWQDAWDAAKNPFVAIQQYFANAPKRKPIIDAWINAIDQWEIVRPKKKEETDFPEERKTRILKKNRESHACTSNRTNSATASR